MTSFDARVRYTGRLTGMWSSLAVVTTVLPPFLYSYCHHHWCPVTVTSTRLEAGGTLAKSKMSFTVGMATPARTSAGIIVQITSALVWPWICTGAWAPGRSRYLTRNSTIAPSTRTKTSTTMMKTDL